MAEMTFEILTLEGEKIRVNSPLSYEWSRDADAACDGIRLSFLTEKPLGEAVEITAYLNGEKVFFGFADYQSEEKSRVFVYARSSACILVDNEAPQAAFNAPSAASLYGFYAKPFGFKSRLKRLFTEYEYTVSKGESCYGAINAFVSAICSKNVAVSPENELYVPDGKTAFYVDPKRIIGIKKAVSRSGAVSRIDYKTDGEYNRHRLSKTLEEKGIIRTRRLNTSNVSAFQRSGVLGRIIRNSARDYYTATLVLDGAEAPQLYSPAVLEGLEGYLVTAFRVMLGKNGEKTELTLAKPLDLKEKDYVA